MTDSPEPMTPADCDLRKLDLPMPVDVMAILHRARGGKTTLENLVTACGPCNSSKSSLLVEEWFK